jgi:rod shape-determining protein MreD
MIHWINFGPAVPDLYFPLVVFYAFITDMKRNAIANWFTGLSKDLFSEGSFGINSIFFVAAGFFIWSVREILFRGHLVTQVLITFIFSVIYNVLYAIHVSISFHTLHFPTTLWIILSCSLYTSMLVPVLFWIFNKFCLSGGFFPIRGE